MTAIPGYKDLNNLSRLMTLTIRFALSASMPTMPCVLWKNLAIQLEQALLPTKLMVEE